MFTDRPPKTIRLPTEYLKSDQLCELDLPGDDRLFTVARRMEEALAGERPAPVRSACAELLGRGGGILPRGSSAIRVLAARPLRVQEGGWTAELFGDYHHDNKLILVWMQTAVQKHVTSFGPFPSTLCHEFCHHPDRERLGFPHTPATPLQPRRILGGVGTAKGVVGLFLKVAAGIRIRRRLDDLAQNFT
jgi:hypothetical protein